MALQDRKLRKCISQIPLHFNKAIGEGNYSSNSNEKEKANYLKSILKVVTNIKVIMKAMNGLVVTVLTRMVVAVIVAINK